MTMQAGHRRGRREDHHDWHSSGYVEDWISGDVTRDDERRPLIRRMLALAPFDPHAIVHVLDVGGGYGVLTEQVLLAFPNARVALQDYSSPMLEHARQRLAGYAGRVAFQRRDFTQPDWTEKLGGPFDLAVSGIAIHNLGPNGPIAQVYQGIFAVLRSGGAFLNLDYPQFAGGLEQHLERLREAGFERVEHAWEAGMQHALAAFRP